MPSQKISRILRSGKLFWGSSTTVGPPKKNLKKRFQTNSARVWDVDYDLYFNFVLFQPPETSQRPAKKKTQVWGMDFISRPWDLPTNCKIIISNQVWETDGCWKKLFPKVWHPSQSYILQRGGAPKSNSTQCLIAQINFNNLGISYTGGPWREIIQNYLSC